MAKLNFLGRLILGSAVFLLLAGGAGWVTLTLFARGGEVYVPEVIGQDIMAAMEQLQGQSLYAVIDREMPHASIPRGYIIGQNPAPGELRKRYSTVSIVLSAGPDRLVMDDLRGFGVRQARVHLNSLGLGSVSEISVYDEKNANGEVVSHIPGPGEVCFPGNPVKLLVSRGLRPVEFAMPDLLGMEIKKAESLMEGHFYPEIEFVKSLDYNPGTVISQIPVPGERVEAFASISLTVASLPEPAEESPQIYSFTAPRGFIDRTIKVIWRRGEDERIIFEELVKPAQEIRLMIPRTGNGIVDVYMDERKVQSDSW